MSVNAMNVRDLWAAKTSGEVVAAFSQLDQYTPETQAIIRAEYERRSSPPARREAPVTDRSPSRAIREVSPRQTSLGAAQASLSSPAGSKVSDAADVSSADSPRFFQRPDSARRYSERNETSENYEYKIVPFLGQSKGGFSANEVARQLESVIAQHAEVGWEFCQLSDVNIEVAPGCLAALFGASAHYIRFDQLIFTKVRIAKPS